MSLRTRLKWAVVGVVLSVGICDAAQARELRSGAAGMEVIYDVLPTTDFRAFLGSQPPGSVSAIVIFEPPPKVAVVARVRLTAPAGRPSLQFTTTFRLANGANVPQNWRIDNAPPGRLEYRAIFGLPQDVVSASTAISR